MQIYIDGEWFPRESARISVFDHGLLYGDGVFEGIRVYSRRIFRLDAHVQRLYASARALALRVPMQADAMASLVREAVARNHCENGYVRLVVTRGAGELGIDPRSCPRASVIVIVTDVSVYARDLYAHGIRVITSATRQVSHDAVDARIKSLNYLKNILGKIDADNAGAHEAILLNGAGFVAECTADNLFVVQRGRLLTPSPRDGALEGITRAAILQLACDAGIAAGEERLTRFDLYTADECFVTGTGAEVMPVATVDGRPVGEVVPGPVTRRLSDAFHALVHREGDPAW
jgi:branched-chain amino acid aminotransferase